MPSKGVLLLPQHRRAFEIMNDQDVRSLVLAVLRYNEGLEVGELSYGAQIAGIFMFEQVDRFNESYDKRCKSNAEIARRREAQRAESAADDVDFDDEYAEAVEMMAEEASAAPAKPKRKSSPRKPKKQDAPDADERDERIEADDAITNEHDDTTNEHEHCTTDNPINPNQNQNTNPSQNQNINTISLSNPNQNPSVSDESCFDETTDKNNDSLRDRETDGAAHEEEYSCFDATSYEKQKTDEGDGLIGDDGDVDSVGLVGLDRVNEKKDLVECGTYAEPKPIPTTSGDCGRITPVIPTMDEVRAFCREHAPEVDAAEFCDYYESRGWKIAGLPVLSWKGLVRTWQNRAAERAASAASVSKKVPSKEPPASYDVDQFLKAAMHHSFDER